MKNVKISSLLNFTNLILIVVFISFFMINLNVTYFGDDYYFLSFKEYDLSGYFSKLGEHYMKDNGRIIVHLFDTILLSIPLIFWQTLNSVMLTLICYMVAKLVAHNKKENIILSIVVVFLLIAFLDISITRQSVYWITGSLNYIYPIFLLLLYWNQLNKINDSNKNFVVAIFLGLLAGASVEQAGMMTFGLTFFMLISKINDFKAFKIKRFLKDNIKLIVLLFVTLIGLATVLLAPSQFIRLDSGDTLDKSEIMINNIKFILNNFMFSKNIFIYNLLFNIFSIIYIVSNKSENLNNKEWIKHFIISACVINFIVSIFNIFINYSNTFEWSKIFAGIIIILSYGNTVIYLNKNIFNKFISPLTIAIFLMIGSQFMMIISPVVGYRNLIAGLIMFSIIIALIVSNIRIEMKKVHFNNIVTLLILFAALSNAKTAKGYYQTKQVDEWNVKVIGEDKVANEIILEKFPDENYCWSMPYISSFHEIYFKNFYNIKGDIIWK